MIDFQEGKTPLLEAYQNGYFDVCKILIVDGKADVTVTDKVYSDLKLEGNKHKIKSFI